MKKRLSRDDYKVSLYYGDEPLGKDKCDTIEKWLIGNVGKEDYDWWWAGYTIALDSREDMVALKLKFGL